MLVFWPFLSIELFFINSNFRIPRIPSEPFFLIIFCIFNLIHLNCIIRNLSFYIIISILVLLHLWLIWNNCRHFFVFLSVVTVNSHSWILFMNNTLTSSFFNTDILIILNMNWRFLFGILVLNWFKSSLRTLLSYFVHYLVCFEL